MGVIKGVKFGVYHTYDDFGLLMTQKYIGAPEVRTKFVDVPGMNGQLDLTEALGAVKFSTRLLRFVFKLIDHDEFITAYSAVLNAIHGKQLNIIVDDDPEFQYTGRCEVSDLESSKLTGKITISATCNPFKYDTDAVVASRVYTVDGDDTFTVHNRAYPVQPAFLTSASNMGIMVDGSVRILPQGVPKTYDDVIFTAGDNTVNFIGWGDVQVQFRGWQL